MTSIPSKRSQVDPFLAMDVLSAAARLEADGRDIVHMEVGQPGAPAPQPVLAAAQKALAGGRLGYTPAVGIEGLRRRISGHYADRYGISVDPSRIVVTTGSSAGFVLAFLSALDTGDSLVSTVPGYPAYRNIVRSLGLNMVELEAGPSDRWSMTPNHIDSAAAAHRLKAVLVASPNNPTGTMIAAPVLESLIERCTHHGLWFISDEIYHGLVYEGEAPTALAFSDDAIVINSFSKYFCMTGWRIGWMVVPQRLVRTVERLAQNIYISVPELSQKAAIAAFDAYDELEAVKAGYAQNRRMLLESLPRLGFDELLPVDGAFYVYANVRRFTNDSLAFSREMLNDAGVAATPGLDFDPTRGNSFIRFSFAGDPAAIETGIARLETWLEKRGSS